MSPSRAIVFLLLLTMAACVPRPSNPAPPRTVLLLSIDTLRADRLGIYGATSPPTPSIDTLGGESLVFETAWSPVPVTLPAHVSMLTGLLPPRHGVRANGVHRLRQDVILATEPFRRAGFATAAFVGGYPLHRSFGLAKGFDHYDDALHDARRAYHPRERRGEEVVARALGWLGRQPMDQPVFLFVHLYDPHADYAPPPPFAERFAEQPYDGEVAYVDSVVGALRAGLEAQGRWREAVVALVADHGESLGEHGEETHSLFLYESALRVPFLVKAPGLAPGRSRRPASLVDVAPILLARAGLPPLQDIDGLDVIVARDDGRDLYAETLVPYLEYGWAGLRALRRGDLKLIDGPGPELYDLRRDPGESRTLWPSPAGGELQRTVREIYGRFSSRRVEPAELDAEARQALDSLGYVAGSSEVPNDFGFARPDPKSRLDVHRGLEEVAGIPPERWQEAVRRLEFLARRDPGNSFIFRLMAATRLAGGDFEGAIEDCLQARRLGYEGEDVTDALAEAYLQAAKLRGKQGELHRARRMLATAVELRPARAEIHEAIGVTEALSGRLEQAAAAFRRATHVNPASANAWFSLGLAQERLGRRGEARESFRRFLDLDPTPSPRREYASTAVASSG